MICVSNGAKRYLSLISYLREGTSLILCPLINPITLRKAKTPQSFGLSECNRVLWRFGHSECNRVKHLQFHSDLKRYSDSAKNQSKNNDAPGLVILLYDQGIYAQYLL